jgi:transposase
LQHGLAELDATVGKALASIHQSARLLTTMPGVSDVTAHVIVAEIGVDMTRFASDAHLRSWAGFCPRNDESAGKRRSTRVRKGAPWLKTTLITAAWAAVRVKDSYLQAQFHRLRARRGAKKAILAVASSMLTAAYHMLKNSVEYKDLGAGHFARRDRSKMIQRLVRRINDLGCQVQLTPLAA